MSLKTGSRVPGQNRPSISRSQPEFYAVAPGSYYSNANYGSGATALFGTFEDVTIEESCSHTMRRLEHGMDFNTTIKLDTESGLVTPDFPSDTSGEIRIRTKFNGVLIPFHTIPQGDVLSPNIPQTHLPLFDVDVNTERPFPFTQGGIGQVKARLLHSGDLALVSVNYANPNNANPVPITVEDIELMFGEGQGNSTFNIRGNYLFA